jgi:ERCC4-type nuclease
MSDITIIVDTREQKPMDFSVYGYKTISKKLDQGDYSVVGYEDEIAIERKASASELAGNLGKGYERFRREWERMDEYPAKIMVCEFPSFHIDEYPNFEKVSWRVKRKIKMTPKQIWARLETIEQEFEIATFFCEDRFEAEQKIIESLETYING